MAGHGDDPVAGKHYDAETLAAYALDQLPIDRAEAVRAHLALCPACRETTAEIAHLAQALERELHQTLETARPSDKLSFERVARGWRTPPRRVSLPRRLTHLATRLAILPLILLLLALAFLAPNENSFARRDLGLAKEYSGPPALAAVAFDDGVAIVRLDPAQPGMVRYVAHVDDPTRLSLAPDGRWLAFQRGGTLHLVETRADGIHAKLDLREIAEWAWSPDSATLAYTDGSGRLVAFDLASQTHTVLVPAGERAWGEPQWSADSMQIAYAVAPSLSGDSSGGSAQSIWRVDPATGYRVELARNPAPDTSLLAPAAWLDRDTLLLAWDARASVQGDQSALYRVDVNARQTVSLEAAAPAQGDQLAWPISPEGHGLALRGHRLVTLDLTTGRARAMPEPLQTPVAAEWAAGGAWLAAIVPGQRGGDGLFLYAPDNGRVMPVRLPAGASEKAVWWAGPEHLFVLRQPDGASRLELWLVSIPGDQAPQRLIANISLPEPGPDGWQWHDAVAVRPVAFSALAP